MKVEQAKELVNLVNTLNNLEEIEAFCKDNPIEINISFNNRNSGEKIHLFDRNDTVRILYSESIKACTAAFILVFKESIEKYELNPSE